MFCFLNILVGKCNDESIRAYLGGLKKDSREANREFFCNLGNNAALYEQPDPNDDNLKYQTILDERGIIYSIVMNYNVLLSFSIFIISSYEYGRRGERDE
jgi:hypothetical protein